jgi:DNA-binding SARP family transcriptional activator
MPGTATPVVLTEKLRRPEPAGLSRRRLEDRLLNDTRSRLQLVVAPPGSGKTTLLAAVAAATRDPVGWYRVTADDAAEAVLVAHLGRSLGDALGIGPVGPTVGDLLEALEAWPGSAAMLILDDLHEVAGTPAERALEHFIALRPQGLRVLVGSRRQPGINVPRLQVSGLLQEISSEDLRFRSWEVEELFQAVFREPLSPESAAALTRRTGGWAAGLQLFHLATTGRSAVERQRAVDDLGGRSKLVRSYLARNVLAELPDERRHFLLRTCTLGALTGELCDALLQTTGSRRVLDELEQQQLFTSSEDDGETFRYHQVLRTHLEWALIQEYGVMGARQWYSRSAALLESVGDERAAVHAYARAEDWGAVARLLQVHGGSGGDPAAVAGLLLPASVVEHDPWLSLAEARRRVREGSLGGAVEAFRRAETLLDEPDFRDICRRERAAAALWSTSRMSWGADADHWSVALREATAHAPRSSSAAGLVRQSRPSPTPSPTPSPSRASAERLGQGLTAVIGGNFASATTLVASVRDDSAAEPMHQLIAQLAGTVLDLICGRSDDPSGQLGRIALDAELAGLPWVARLSRGLQDAVLLAQGTASWRRKACLDLVAECDRSGDAWGAALLRLATAVGGTIAGADLDVGDFDDAARRFADLDAPVLVSWAQALKAVMLVASGSERGAAFAAEVARRARAERLTGPATLASSVASSALASTAKAAALGQNHRSASSSVMADAVSGSAGSGHGRSVIPGAGASAAEAAMARSEAFGTTGSGSGQVGDADIRTIRRMADALLTARPSARDAAMSSDGGSADASTVAAQPMAHPANTAPATGSTRPADHSRAQAITDAAVDPVTGSSAGNAADTATTVVAPTAGPAQGTLTAPAVRPAALAVTSLAVLRAQTGADPVPRLLHIRCFGGFEIDVDGRPVDLTVLRPRARALLRMLSLTPHRDVHREYLVDALWPGTDLTVGTRRLQVAMSSVRQVLEHAGLCGSEVLARQGDAYRLAPPAGSVIDIRAFEDALAQAAAAAARGDTDAAMTARAAALALYRGDALPEDGPADHVVAERERLRLAAAAAAAALAQDSRALGHPRQALAAARRSVQLDRYQDFGWRLLIQLHEEAGDDSAATLARRDHAQVQAELELVTG